MKFMETGIDILNTGLGHMEVRFDKDEAIEQERARRIITDMLRRGYALFLTGQDGKMIRVKDFDPATDCYIIGDGPTDPEPAMLEPEPVAEPGIAVAPPLKRGRKGKHVPMGKVLATAVGRTAGG